MTGSQFFSDEAIAALNRDCAEIGRRTRAAAEAITKAFTPAIQRCFAAMQPLIDWANSPEGRAALAAYEARKAAGMLVETSACHCLCGHNHPGRSLCRGEVPVSDLTTVMYRTRELGMQDVPMCQPCADMALTEKALT